MAREKIKQLSIPASKRYLKKACPVMSQLIDKVKLFKIPDKPNNFETFVSIIAGQMLSGKAARTIFMRVKKLAGGKTITPDKINSLTDDQIREAGLSWAKIRSIRSFVEHVEDGRLKIRRLPYMDDDEVYRAITSVKGLGDWSAQMFLMFRLRRPDIFPPCDVGIQNAICKLFNKKRGKTDFEKFAERWKPHRTVASMYLWSYLHNPVEIKK